MLIVVNFEQQIDGISTSRKGEEGMIRWQKESPGVLRGQ